MEDAFIFFFGVIVTAVALGPLFYAAAAEWTTKRNDRSNDGS